MDPVGNHHSNGAANLGAEGLNRCLMLIAQVAGPALFIIGCVGASGVFPGSSIGWVTVGLGGGTFALSLAEGNLKNRKFDLLFRGLSTATLIIVGVLGGTGILSTPQVGWGIISTGLARIPIFCIMRCCQAVQNQNGIQKSEQSSQVTQKQKERIRQQRLKKIKEQQEQIKLRDFKEAFPNEFPESQFTGKLQAQQ